MSRWEVRRYPRLDSANQTALDLAAAGGAEWTVVVADEQGAGRGRRGRSWHSPVGGLWFSVILRNTRLDGLNLVGSLACAELARQHGVRAHILWPNDLYVGGRKLAGVLSEGRFAGGQLEHAVLGVGLNVNLTEQDFPDELLDQATSLSLETGSPLQLDTVLEALLERLYSFHQVHREAGLQALLPEIRPLCVFLGKPVRLHLGDSVVREGTADGLTPHGALVLDDGSVHYSVERLELLEA